MPTDVTTKPRQSEVIFVDRDNDGELYVCAEPLRWIQDPLNPVKLSAPVPMTRQQFALTAARELSGRIRALKGRR